MFLSNMDIGHGMDLGSGSCVRLDKGALLTINDGCRGICSSPAKAISAPLAPNWHDSCNARGCYCLRNSRTFTMHQPGHQAQAAAARHGGQIIFQNNANRACNR